MKQKFYNDVNLINHINKLKQMKQVLFLLLLLLFPIIYANAIDNSKYMNHNLDGNNIILCINDYENIKLLEKYFTKFIFTELIFKNDNIIDNKINLYCGNFEQLSLKEIKKSEKIDLDLAINSNTSLSYFEYHKKDIRLEILKILLIGGLCGLFALWFFFVGIDL
ncbi:hypothetical protein Hokovirus_1_49 [Hokovirus HKV1]|uniref:Transmembrane protein n=1 Tax=Hokovirus HKV1 TaxID=1977638 RepID=A0A1V0SEL8_9VIRU|nr:hypothetical protein Hokovirus_1_49 [Hokovirus HKV1]